MNWSAVSRDRKWCWPVPMPCSALPSCACRSYGIVARTLTLAEYGQLHGCCRSRLCDSLPHTMVVKAKSVTVINGSRNTQCFQQHHRCELCSIVCFFWMDWCLNQSESTSVHDGGESSTAEQSVPVRTNLPFIGCYTIDFQLWMPIQKVVFHSSAWLHSFTIQTTSPSVSAEFCLTLHSFCMCRRKGIGQIYNKETVCGWWKAQLKCHIYNYFQWFLICQCFLAMLAR